MFVSRAAALGALCVTLAMPSGAALAADFPETWRDSYDCCNESAFEDAIGFEFGLRYVYSVGNHQMTAGGNYAIDDTSHIVEAHGRIDDYSTSSFLRGSAGLSAATNGTYTTPTSGGTQSFQGGVLSYAGGDFGWTPVGTDGFRFGGFIGYRYMNESPDMGWVAGPVARTRNDLEIHALRLGLTARAEFNDVIDITADAAVVPYAPLSGTHGAFATGAASVDGSLYGAQGQIAFGYKPVPNAKIEVGARASYLTGEARLTNAGGTTNTTNLSFTRMGAFAGLAFSF